MKQQILVDIGGILTLKVYTNGIQVIPTTPKIEIKDNAGAVVIAEIAAAVDAEGTMTYALAAAKVPDVARNWKVNWNYQDSGTQRESQLFDIVNQILINNVINLDIIKRAQFLKKLNYRLNFTAESGTVNTIVNEAELIQESEWWVNGLVEVTSGTNQGEIRKVTIFDNPTNKLTVSPDFSADIDDTSIILLIRSFEKEIIEAFDIFANDLNNKELKTDLIIDSSQVREFIINKTIEIVCGNFTKDIADIWTAREEKFKSNYDKLFDNLNLDYDANNDGLVDADEADTSFSQPGGVR